MCLMGMLVDSYDSLLSLMSISWRGRERFANGTCSWYTLRLPLALFQVYTECVCVCIGSPWDLLFA